MSSHPTMLRYRVHNVMAMMKDEENKAIACLIR